MSELLKILTEMRQEIAELKRQAARNQFGTVCDRDPVKGFRVQVGIDDDGAPKKTAWLPHPDHGGEASSWAPLSIGQTVMVMTPSGDPRKAVVLRCGFNGEFEQPSQSFDENVFRFGKSKVTMKKEETEMTVDDSFARLIGDKAFVGVRWPGSEHFTDIEIRRDNIIFTVRRSNGQVVRRVTVI